MSNTQDMPVMCQGKTVLSPSPEDSVEGSGMPKPKVMDARKIIPMPSELVKRISDFRHGERISSEAEAIRLLIMAGLKSRGYPMKDPATKDEESE
ncbi:hypothetical protein VQ042_11480 [Aurantimonas sp. A2-1-M11]|uniref:hypothetical protein n=1 Tax=Aurantimonas sp. A2-1-M11 TaxID=3113712 RepID=UPI002F95293C